MQKKEDIEQELFTLFQLYRADLKYIIECLERIHEKLYRELAQQDRVRD